MKLRYLAYVLLGLIAIGATSPVISMTDNSSEKPGILYRAGAGVMGLAQLGVVYWNGKKLLRFGMALIDEFDGFMEDPLVYSLYHSADAVAFANAVGFANSNFKEAFSPRSEKNIRNASKIGISSRLGYGALGSIQLYYAYRGLSAFTGMIKYILNNPDFFTKLPLKRSGLIMVSKFFVMANAAYLAYTNFKEAFKPESLEEEL